MSSMNLIPPLAFPRVRGSLFWPLILIADCFVYMVWIYWFWLLIFAFEMWLTAGDQSTRDAYFSYAPWSYLCICRESVLPYTQFCICFLDYDCVWHIINFAVKYRWLTLCTTSTLQYEQTDALLIPNCISSTAKEVDEMFLL
jgi:hypothetical protein